MTEGREETKEVALKCKARGTEDFGSELGVSTGAERTREPSRRT